MNPVKKAFVRAISWYCTYSPLLQGKSQLQSLGLRIINSPSVTAISRNGQKFILEFPQDRGWEFLFFGGTYETGTVDVLRSVLRPDDVAFDIGANIGWYTVNLALLLPKGRCHAFEPMPPTFERLTRNCALNGLGENIEFNQIALGDQEGSVTLHSFDSLGHGHNSLSTRGRTDYTTWDVAITTLNEYVDRNAIKRVDLVKMDVEGAEMGVLAGADRLFSLESPPIWIIEMNVETSANFKHTPEDLLQAIAKRGEYSFYRVVRGWKEVVPMASLADYHHGDNAVCVPRSRLDLWKKAIGK